MSQKNQGPRRMHWWISGDWPHGVMDSVLRQSICLTINKSGMTPEQIARRIDANEVYVREALDALEAEELVEKVGRGRYRSKFVAVSAEDLIELDREIRPKAECVADLLEEALPELQAAWEKSPKPAQGFGWDTGIWLTTAILVCQYGRPRNGSRTPYTEPPLHPASGKRYTSGGQEVIAPEHRLWQLGLGLHVDSEFSYGWLSPDGLGFGRRRIDGLPRERRALFGAVASGSRDIDSAAEAAGLDMDRAREAAAGAIELGLLERTMDGFALTFPVFTSEDDDALLAAVDRVSEGVSRIVDPITHLVDQKLSEFGFGYLEEQFGAWHSHPGYQVAAEGIRVIFKRGSLPCPGDPAPANFCMWGWLEPTELFAWEK